MADFQQLALQNQQHLDEYATRIVRIEAHLRRGEFRAANARLQGLAAELLNERETLEFPIQPIFMGVQMGLLAGRGSLLRGRLPAALLCAVGGWMYGNQLTVRRQSQVDELLSRCYALETLLRETAPRTGSSPV